MNRSLPPRECWTRWAAFALAIFCCFSPGSGGAQDAKQNEESNPVVRLDFESEATISWTEKGSLIRDQEGPRPPEFPDFSPNNHAIRLQPGRAHLIIPDTGKASPLDFGNGDLLSIEAWVEPDPNSKTSPMMVVGKGRTGNPKFAKDNQNWACDWWPNKANTA